MKYKTLLILFFLFVFITVSCKKNVSLNVNAAIIKYNLVYDTDTGADLYHSNWMRKGTIYGNRVTDSCLVIVINRKGDTILTHLDKGIASWYYSQTIKKHNNFFIKKRNFGKTVYDFEIDSTKLSMHIKNNEIDYPMDGYYLMDTIDKKLKKISIINETELKKRIANKYKFLKNTKILALSNTYIYVAKDTLIDKQVYYQINAKYEIEKAKDNFVLMPHFYSTNAYIHSMGIYKNNITSHSGKFGNTLVNISVDTIGQNVSKYDIYLKEYTKFSCDTKRYPYCHDEFIKLEVIVHERTKKNKKIIETFTNDAFFENQHFNMFKYKNADYFIGVLPTVDKGYNKSLFRLDTIHWKLDQVEKFDKKKDKNFRRYKKGRDALVSGNVLGEMDTFLTQYEIVKVNGGYRLITPENL